MTTVDLQDIYNYKYVTYDVNGARTKIVCRKCGETMAELVDNLFKMMTNYAKVQLCLSNDMEMYSAMCKTCVKHLSKKELDNVYKSEIQAIEWDAEIRGLTMQMAPLVTALLGLSVVRRIN